MSTDDLRSESRSHYVLAGSITAAFAVFVLAVYGPDVGRGFVKDDFTWIRGAKAALADPISALHPQVPGFYRPVVTLTFALDYARHGWQPSGYGWTNLALYLACIVAIVTLGRSFRLSWWASLMAGLVWAVNPHGINMALVWLSGRTALCLTLFSVLAAALFLRRHYVFASFFVLLALLSKEEAVLLPFILIAWTWIEGRRERRPFPWRVVVTAVVPLAVYLALRYTTPAFTISSAPPVYQFSVAPGAIIRNVVEYLDRSTTAVAVVVALGCALFRARPAFEMSSQVAMMVTWWVGMFAITLWLPIRSSLYAVCPSVGVSLLGAMWLDHMRVQSSRAAWRFEAVLAIALVAAIPAYRPRNGRWVEGARVSQRILDAIAADAAHLPERGVIVFDDRDDIPSNLHNAFGDLSTEALQTVFERQWVARIGIAPGDAHDAIATYQLLRGRVMRVHKPPPKPSIHASALQRGFDSNPRGNRAE